MTLNDTLGLRICSLLPSATEIMYALGIEHQLVGVTHECDYPSGALSKPIVTKSKITPLLSSRAIDFRVKQQLAEVGSLYSLDATLLESLKPDIILTQQLCTVCAVSYENVARIAHQLGRKPQIVNLEPSSLEGIFQNIVTVGLLTGTSERAEKIVQNFRKRVSRIADVVRGLEEKSILCLEWLNPPFCAGHWIPELVELAGGVDMLGEKHQPSRQVAWDEILSYNPDIIVIMCCGFSVQRTIKELSILQNSTFENLQAVRSGRVYVVDGSSFFSRPGPRIVDSLEIMATIIYPDMFPFDYPEQVMKQIHSDKGFSLTSHIL